MKHRAVEIELVPTQVEDLGGPKTVPEGDQDHGGIAVPVAIALGGLDQCCDLIRGEVLSGSQFGVRVCAPMALRVRVMIERLGVKDTDAIQEEIERFDAGHSRAMRAAFNFDWNDALIYHMVLNTARMPVDACVKAVCQLAEHPKFQDVPAITGAALADKLLETKINTALAEHISITDVPNGISVLVADGKVTLAGTSSSGNVRDKAEKLAQAIAGVREIDNRIISVPSRGGMLYN